MAKHIETYRRIEQFANASSLFELFPDYGVEKDGVNYGEAVLACTVLSGIVATSVLFDSGQVLAQASDAAPKVVVIADSIGEGIEATDGEIKMESLGLDVVVYDALKGRSYLFAGCEDGDCPVVSGVAAIDGKRAINYSAAQIEMADLVFMPLGTNASSIPTREATIQAGQQIYEISNRDGRPAISVFSELYGSNPNVDSANRNAEIYAAVAELNAQGIPSRVIAVKDFVEGTIGASGGIASDGVHLNFRTGYPMLGQLQADLIAPIAKEQYAKNYPPATSEAVVVPTVLTEKPVVLAETADVGVLKNGFVLDLSQPKKIVQDQAVDMFVAQPTMPIGFVLDLNVPTVAAAQPDRNVISFQPVDSEEVSNLLEPAKGFVIDTSLPSRTQDGIISGIEFIPTTKITEIVDTTKVVELQPYVVVEQAPVPEPQQTQSPEAVVSEVDFKTMYSITGDNVVHAEPLMEFIRSNFPKAGDKSMFPDGDYYRLPDHIDGLPYDFSTIASPNERYADIKVIAFSIIMSEMHKERMTRFPGLLPKYIQDMTSDHIEHENGGDVDWGLNNIADARAEELIDIIRLRNPDGSAFVHHLVLGDANLKQIGENYLSNMGYERTNLILQTDHGTEYGAGAHWHVSLDGGGNGPFLLPKAHVPLTNGMGSEITNIINPSSQILTQPSVVDEKAVAVSQPDIQHGFVFDVSRTKKQPGQTTTSQPETITTIDEILGSETVRIVPGEVTAVNLGVGPVNSYIDTVLSTGTPARPNLDAHTQKDVVRDDTVLDNTLVTGDNIQDEQPAAVDASQAAEEATLPIPEPVSEPVSEPQPMPTPAQDQNPEVQAVPLREVFVDDLVQIVLPNAPRENITNNTPLLLSALAEIGIADKQMACYAFATIQPETSSFAPIDEYGKGHGRDYGVPDAQTGKIYHGRGFIQLTWKSNYEAAGEAIGIDLVNQPELANDPTTASRIMAWYLKNRESNIRNALNNGDMRAARQVVNGRAAHGLEQFSDAYARCAQALGM